jgi:hypothetical protein
MAGITMSDSKKALVSGRLAKRLQHHGLPTYDAYFQLLQSGQHANEVQLAVDLLTTNETYFFREARHFDLLREAAEAARPGLRAGAPFRVWSAACSSGEEPYSIAMVLADVLGDAPWEVWPPTSAPACCSARALGSLSDGARQPRAAGLPAPLLPEGHSRAGRARCWWTARCASACSSAR